MSIAVASSPMAINTATTPLGPICGPVGSPVGQMTQPRTPDRAMRSHSAPSSTGLAVQLMPARRAAPALQVAPWPDPALDPACAPAPGLEGRTPPVWADGGHVWEAPCLQLSCSAKSPCAAPQGHVMGYTCLPGEVAANQAGVCQKRQILATAQVLLGNRGGGGQAGIIAGHQERQRQRAGRGSA